MKQPWQKYEIKTTTRFDKSFRRLNDDDKMKVRNVINTIANGLTLGSEYKDHPLKGNKRGVRDCHVKPDLVLLYTLDKEILVLMAMDVGSHSNLFH